MGESWTCNGGSLTLTLDPKNSVSDFAERKNKYMNNKKMSDH
jgi:hypothetical protein